MVGAVGTLGSILVLVFVGVVGLLTCCVGCCGSILSPHVVTRVHMEATAAEVRNFEKNNARLPASLDEVSGHHRRSTRDGWDRPFHLTVESDGSFTLTSDGPDGIEGTRDDVRENFRSRSGAH